jgi:hypothetical protein
MPLLILELISSSEPNNMVPTRVLFLVALITGVQTCTSINHVTVHAHVAITLDIKVTGQSYNIYISKSHPKLDASRDVMLFSSLLLSGIGINFFFLVP